MCVLERIHVRACHNSVVYILVTIAAVAVMIRDGNLTSSVTSSLVTSTILFEVVCGQA